MPPIRRYVAAATAALYSLPAQAQPGPPVLDGLYARPIDSVRVEVALEPTLSSDEPEFSAVFLAGDVAFVSTRRRLRSRRVRTDSLLAGRLTTLMLAGTRDGEAFAEPVALLTPRGGLYHEGPASFAADAGELYLTRNRRLGPRRARELRVGRRDVELGIFAASRKGNGYSEPEPVTFSRPGSSDAHPAVSPDGSYVVFASDRRGGAGGMDLWCARRSADGSWGEPDNLGSGVNSPGNEVFPTLGPGGVLYFASDSLGGGGGALDVFAARRADGPAGRDAWRDPTRLPAPINGPADDFGFAIAPDGSRAFLSSTRPAALADDNLYAVDIDTVRELPATLRVLGADSLPLAGVRVSVPPPRGYRDTLAYVTDAGGLVELELRGYYDAVVVISPGTSADADSAYVAAFDEGTLEATVLYTPAASAPRAVALSGENLLAGETIELKTFYYDFDDHRLRRPARRTLDTLVAILEAYPAIRIALRSHTDRRGRRAYNDALSLRRASYARAYLVAAGIDSRRVLGLGLGESEPRIACRRCTEYEHQVNRRTEVRLLESFDGARVEAADNRPEIVRTASGRLLR